MNDHELRTLVREALGRHLGHPMAPRDGGATGPDTAGWTGHPSHSIYLNVQSGSEACLIEPAVPCTHCGYCKSHGH